MSMGSKPKAAPPPPPPPQREDANEVRAKKEEAERRNRNASGRSSTIKTLLGDVATEGFSASKTLTGG
jgi:hypothetical protein